MRRLGIRLGTGAADNSEGDGKQPLVVTPHKLMRVESVTCYRTAEGVRMSFAIRNMGTELTSYGIKVINNFDPRGREYDYVMNFGKAGSSSRQMLHYTLPYDIPITITIEFPGEWDGVDRIAQVKFAGLCTHRKRNREKYNPTGSFLFRNVPIEEQGCGGL